MLLAFFWQNLDYLTLIFANCLSWFMSKSGKVKVITDIGFTLFFEALAFCSCKTIIPWPNSKIGHERTYLPSCRKLRTFTSKVVLLPVTQAKSQRVQNWLKFERMPFLSLFFLQFLQKMAFSVVLIAVRLSFQLFTI